MNNLLKLDTKGKKYKYIIFYNVLNNLGTGFGNCEYYTDYRIEYLDIKKVSKLIAKNLGYENIIITGWKYMYSKEEINQLKEAAE